jgi:hypothetical protein
MIFEKKKKWCDDLTGGSGDFHRLTTGETREDVSHQQKAEMSRHGNTRHITSFGVRVRTNGYDVHDCGNSSFSLEILLQALNVKWFRIIE